MEFIKNLNSTPYLVFGLYWVPVVVCGIYYTLEIIKLYKEDVKNREKDYYHPNLTIGKILMYILFVFIPFVNLLKFIFDIFPDLLNVLDIPLVPAKKKEK